MKELLNEIETRRAYRAFSGERADDLQITRILQAGHLAASCFNNQPWRFVVYRSEEELAPLFPLLSKGNLWAQKSAFMVAVAAAYEDDCRLSEQRDYALFDTGMALENMLLQAVHEGMYAHPMAGFDPVGLREYSKIPEQMVIITLVAFGFPGDVQLLDERLQKAEASQRVRRPLDTVVHYGSW